MPVRCVIWHIVEDNLQASLVGFPKQSLELIHGAEHRVDVAVVCNVVAEIGHGRRIDRRQPDGIDAKAGEMVDPCGDSVQVSDAVAAGILEGTGIDLVDDPALPPFELARKRVMFRRRVVSSHVQRSCCRLGAFPAAGHLLRLRDGLVQGPQVGAFRPGQPLAPTSAEYAGKEDYRKHERLASHASSLSEHGPGSVSGTLNCAKSMSSQLRGAAMRVVLLRSLAKHFRSRSFCLTTVLLAVSAQHPAAKADDEVRRWPMGHRNSTA